MFVCSLYFLCRKMDTLHFERQIHCYVVREGNEYILTKRRDLLDHHPLPICQVNKKEVIALHHKVTCEI